MSTSGVLGLLLLLSSLKRVVWASGVAVSGVLGLLLLCTLDRDGMALPGVMLPPKDKVMDRGSQQ